MLHYPTSVVGMLCWQPATHISQLLQVLHPNECNDESFIIHPATHKRAVVKTLLCRDEALSSSGVSRMEKHVTKALQKNGYPISFICRHPVPARPSQVLDSSGWCA